MDPQLSLGLGEEEPPVRCQLSPEAADELEQLLTAEHVDTPLALGEVRVMFSPLPGRTLCAAVRIMGVLWIALDDGKAWCRGHGAEMMADARAGGDAVRRLRSIPSPRGECRLELVS